MKSIRTDPAAAKLLEPDTEKQFDFSESRTGRTWPNRGTLLWTCICSLVFNLVVILYFLITTSQSYNDFIPTISKQSVLFEPDDRFLESPHGQDSPWNELEPLGRGFVKVPTTHQEGIGRGSPLKDGAGEYCLSVFHQLHCLAVLRTTLTSLRSGDNEERDEHSDGHLAMHADHCIDYLRQAVMCAGDMTLEHYVVYENGTLGPGVDGYFVNHQCKSWDQIMAFATEHRSRNVHGIL